ncbi:MAG: hypothetical protein ACI837_002092 [Crocinitomicaceae bacterium]|jgi:hypothetical protein
MNKVINVLLGVLLLPTMFIAIYVGLDLPIGFLHVSGNNLPHKDWVFLGLGLASAIIILRRAIRRWMGMRIVNQVKKFKWNAPVSKSRKSRVQLYLSLEALVMVAMGIGLYTVSEDALAPAIAYGIGALDNILFAIAGEKDRYRVGISSKALIVADREVIFLYFSGLRKVSAQQQTTYFDYIKGLQITFPTNCVRDENKQEFLKVLEDQLDRDRVFFSKTMNTVEAPTS